MRRHTRSLGLALAAALVAGVLGKPSFAGPDRAGEGAAVDAGAGAGAMGDESERAIARGVDFLLALQNRNGSWGSGASARPIEILAAVPGSHDAFRVGTTALCLMALARSPCRQAECRDAVLRALRYLLVHHRVRRPNGMELYNVWSFGFTLQAFCDALAILDDATFDAATADGEGLRAEILGASRGLVRALELYQTPDGGWGYYDFVVGSYRPSDSSMSFTTATVLVSLHAVKQHGVEVPRAMVERALKSLRRSRKEDGSYIYGPYAQYRPAVGFNEVKGSLGRTPTCDLALWIHGLDVPRSDLRRGVERLLALHHFLDIGRKRPFPHEAWYSNSGYYFYYGHYYARRVLDILPAADRRHLLSRLREVITARQERDGSWWDFPLYGYHKAYGTAFALLTLVP
jgi:hypothetical protein